MVLGGWQWSGEVFLGGDGLENPVRKWDGLDPNSPHGQVLLSSRAIHDSPCE